MLFIVSLQRKCEPMIDISLYWKPEYNETGHTILKRLQIISYGTRVGAVALNARCGRAGRTGMCGVYICLALLLLVMIVVAAAPP